MILAENLFKRFAGVQALRGISFRVEKGEIVGFLGPNGAGKTTTMRILSGYMPPTSGRVRIAGFDAFTHSIEVRRRIGYMPEVVPLHPELRVREFLSYRAQLKGVRGPRIRQRIEEVCHLCGLEEVSGKIIGTLSKGFKQRVGLADAMVHDPELLILDEPTIGLDPNQIRQVRELVRSLGRRHTILLSTHILPEVEATCSRVLIIHKGRIEASDTPENLTRQLHDGGPVRIEVKAPEAELSAALKAIPSVDEVTITDAAGWLQARVFSHRGEDLREAVHRAIAPRGWPLRELTRQRATLEDVFVELTHEERA
jgi:ABC-2 type transport system ATP-binding protein